MLLLCGSNYQVSSVLKFPRSNFQDLISKIFLTLPDDNFLRRLIESIDELNQGVVAFDEDGGVFYANHIAAKSLKKPINELLGSHFRSVFPGINLEIPFSLKQPQILTLHDFPEKKELALLIPSIVGGLIVICIDSQVFHSFDVGANQDWTAKYRFSDIIGISDVLHNAIKRARQVVGTDATVLITGESGTGKELFAHAIHAESRRQNKPFVRLNCASMPTELLEAELFGYEAGAFTGAKKKGQLGMFELSNMGTIFLDEISQMNWDIQAKLLRVLQEKEIIRVGGTKPIMVDFRLILATNASLEEMVKVGKFRSDLYYRINVFPIVIPPLRERREDVHVLIDYFAERFRSDPNIEPKRLSVDVLRIFENYRWPGNVRELLHALEQLFISSASSVITPKNLPIYFLENDSKDELSRDVDIEENLGEIMEKFEKEILVKALCKKGENKRETAKLLGIHRSGLYKKLKKYGL